MKSSMSSSHNFATVPVITGIRRSSFKRDRRYKTTFNADFLVPFFVDQVLPGDTINYSLTCFSRMLSALSVPVMDNLYIDFHFWYAPNRILWDNFVKQMGEQNNPSDSIDYLTPALVPPVGGFSESSLADYFGIPTKIQSANVTTINLLPFRMYNKTYNFNYRDENLQNSVPEFTGNSGDAWTDYTLLKRGKRHDYFTAMLPAAQKGSAVTMSLGTSAPVKGIGIDSTSSSASPTQSLRETGNSTPHTFTGGQYAATGGGLYIQTAGAGSGVSATPNVYADLSAATAATINTLRTSIAIQQLLERDARGGTRYVELVPNHFGVSVPDYRVSKPEFLGGGTVRVGVNTIVQSSATAAGSTAQGNVAGFATAGNTSRIGFLKSFVEHGFVMGLMNVRADLNYQNGLERIWSLSTRYDYMWPTFANLGEQPVYNREWFMQDTAADNAVAGYQERYGDLRYGISKITGLLRSNATGTLQSWTLTQNFASLPSLDSTFIQSNTPMSRIKAVTTVPDFIIDIASDETWARPLPVFAVPGLVRL